MARFPERALGRRRQAGSSREQARHIIAEIWPKTPHPHFAAGHHFRPAQAGDSETFLRASVRRMEGAYERPEQAARLERASTRSSHSSPEPAIDPETVEIDQLHLSRLAVGPRRAA